MSDRPSWPELRRVLLAETDPMPGMERRVLSGAQATSGGLRPSWALGAAAVVLTIAVVVTLLLASRLAQRTTVPVAPLTPSPAGSPPAVSALPLSSAVLDASGAGWVIEDSQRPPLTGDETLLRTTDGGAHWSTPLDLGVGFGEVSVGPGDQALVYVMGGSVGTEQSFFFSTADAGVHWQRHAAPASGDRVQMKDGREAWLTSQGPAQWVVYHTTDGAQTWQRETTIDLARMFGAANLGGAWASNGQYGVYVTQTQSGASKRVFTTSDGGAHWWLLARDGRVFSSADEGVTWTPVGSLPRGLTPMSADFTAAGAGLVTASSLRPGVANVLLGTSDGGRTWRTIVPPHPFRPAVPCGGRATVTAHAQLTVTYNGKAQPGVVPPGVGMTYACRYRLFTTDDSGTIDIATTPSERGRIYTLGDLLDVWGVPDLQSVGPTVASNVRVSVQVDGRATRGRSRCATEPGW